MEESSIIAERAPMRLALAPYLSLAAVATVVAFMAACKDTSHVIEDAAGPGTGDEDSPIIAGHAKQAKAASEQVGFYAADPESLQKNSDFFFKVFDDTFTRKLA